jgi:uncharacterized protein (TIGR02271 family)
MAMTVVGLFDDFAEAERAVREILNLGVAREDVSLVANDAAKRVSGGSHAHTGNHAGSGAAAGATGGAILGGIGGLLLGMGVFAIPGLGAIVAAGPLVAALTGAGIGAVAGGLLGALTGMGVPEEEAGYYAEGVRRGGALVTARAEEGNAGAIANLMRLHGAVDIEARAAQWRQAGWSGYDPKAEPYTEEQIARDRAAFRAAPASGEEVRLPVVEETMTVGKQAVDQGAVRVYSHVVETPVREQVAVREEHVNVERRPVNREATEADLGAFQEGVIEIAETVEQPVVSKQARVVEEVVVNKTVEQRDEVIQDTVRHTEVDVEDLRGRTAANAPTDPNDPLRRRAA